MTHFSRSPPRRLIADSALTTGARLLWLSLWHDADTTNEDTIPESLAVTTKQTMAMRLGAAPNTINRYIRELRDHGWLANSDNTSVQTWALNPKGTSDDWAPERASPGASEVSA